MNAGKPWRKSSVSHQNSQGVRMFSGILTFRARISARFDNSVQQKIFLS